ncbi:YitT family protein [Litoreibacter janthinus]|uniref:Uncharacterized 5xTM membrane BCR, YitT family COG1284 n=1 Tax=Litoreibacter janthinus TaxID=670154 RepID=A0A1I6H2B3_9RHOB|nr:YitT family protein [Litoreibacter janthinus]SFR48589.1 Uncharacterised 5xTM membrane BCR, YitT family COG1284 [Litoreibacter janthinus]
MAEPHKPTDHRLHEDIQAFVLGTGLCALGIVLFTHAGLIAGQTAGLAVLLSYMSPFSFGLIFFVVNLPFYALALLRMGLRFTMRSFAAVTLLSLWAEFLPHVLKISYIHPGAAAVLGGAVSGMGLIIIFRHGGSLGGIGVLGLYLQDKINVQAGWIQLGFDVILFAMAFLLLPWPQVMWSLLGAVVVNLIIGVNHRKDRYTGQ